MKKFNGKTTIKYSKPYDTLNIVWERNKDLPFNMVDDNISLLYDKKRHVTVIEIRNIKNIKTKYDTHEKMKKGLSNDSVCNMATPSYY